MAEFLHITYSKKVAAAADGWEAKATIFDDDSYLSDAKDLREISVLLADGDIDEAKERIASLDTIVRDEIPDSVYYGLMGN